MNELILPEEKQMKTGIELIAEERQRQIKKLGWTAKHDDGHDQEELARVGALYALPKRYREYYNIYPKTWDFCWWQPEENRVRELAKAGALIAAEIDRLQRVRLP
jgi:hypothetical protein